MRTGTTWHEAPAARMASASAASAWRHPIVVPRETSAMSGLDVRPQTSDLRLRLTSRLTCLTASRRS